MNTYKRPVSQPESLFSLSPVSVVAMLFRVKGSITKNRFEEAVNFVQKKHPLLQVRITIDNEEKIFSSEGAGPMEIKTISRKSESQWIDLYHSQCQIPFEFDEKSCIRFFLLQSKDACDIMIFSHHIICDGLSLAYIGRDILEHLGNKAESEPEVLHAVPISKNNLPPGLKANWLVKKIIGRMNDKFNRKRVVFDFHDYKDLHRGYWSSCSHQMIPLELSKEETASLIEACKENNVSVNSVVSAALIGAQEISCENKKVPPKHSVAVNIRDMITYSPGEGMGFYAAAIEISFVYNTAKDIWFNAKKFNTQVKSKLSVKSIFKNILHWCYLEAGFLESFVIKLTGHLVKDNEKLSSYSKRDDVVSSLMKRGKINSPDIVLAGTAVTNLGNLNFPEKFGTLELDSIIMNPGGAFPLKMVQLIAAVVTTSGKMTVLLEFDENRISIEQLHKVKKHFKKLLGL